jgi:hypothetical protein
MASSSLTKNASKCKCRSQRAADDSGQIAGNPECLTVENRPFPSSRIGAKGMKPEMARLTLARKIAAITLTLWKKEERFDAEH